MRRILLGICVCIAGVVVAQDNLSPALSSGYGERPEVVDSIAAQDSIEIEEPLTVEADTLPLEIQEFIAELFAPEAENAPIRRAGAGTHLDSVVYTNQNGAVTKIMRYDYDEYGARYRNSTEYFDPATGQHMSSSMMSESKNGGVSGGLLNASYNWSTATDQWEGTTRTEKIYNANSKQITQVTYSWNPGYSYWTPTATTTWVYDGSRVPENWTWTIDASTKKLKPATRTQQVWDSKGNLILKVVYKGGTTNGQEDGEWIGGSGGTKNIYQFQDFGSLNKKVLDEAYTWNVSKNDWAGKNSGKTTWNYTADGSKEVEKMVYNWSATNWQYEPASVVYTEYDAAGHTIATYPYKWTNGNRVGNGNAMRYFYTGNNADSTLTYTWVNGTGWVNTKIVVKIVNGSGKVTVNETWNYNTSTQVWSGSGTYNYYAANNTTQIGLTTYTLANSIWTPKDSTAYIYNGTTKVSDEVYSWSTTENRWVAKTLKNYFDGGNVTYTYATGQWSGSKTVPYSEPNGTTGSITYRCNADSTWYIYSATKSHIYTDAEGTSIKLYWDMQQAPDSVWTFKNGTKTPVNTTNGYGKVICQRSYYCNADSVWKVNNYTVWDYDNGGSGQQIYTASFTKDSVPTSYTETTYNLKGNMLTQEQMNYSNGNWVGHHRYEYVYLSDGETKESNTFYTSWSTVCNDWKGSTKTEWTYMASGQTETMTEYSWTQNTCDWTPLMKHYYTYDSAGNTTVLIDQKPSGNSWVNYQKTEKEYIGTTEIKNTLYTWTNGEWVSTTTHETEYLPGSTSDKRTELNVTYNADGSIATYELATYHYNTD